MVFVAELSLQQTWVVGRRGNHAQHLPGARFDGDNSTDLAFQHTFAKCLKTDVQTQRKVFSGYRTTVVFAMLVFSLDTSMGITEKNLHAFLTTEILFVATLNAQFSDVVAGLIIRILVYVGLRNLTDIA